MRLCALHPPVRANEFCVDALRGWGPLSEPIVAKPDTQPDNKRTGGSSILVGPQNALAPEFSDSMSQELAGSADIEYACYGISRW